MISSARPSHIFATRWSRLVQLLSVSLAGIAAIAGAEDSASLSPEGAEFQVNDYTTGSQILPRVARHDSGFVVVWMSSGSGGTDSNGSSIQARRFTLDGTPQGNQFQVNTTTNGNQNFPTISAWPDGRFLIAWNEPLNSEVAAQLYHSDGSANGGELLLNSYTTGTQRLPSLVTTSNGELIAVWNSGQSPGSDSSGSSILARRFDSNASPVGEDLQVNSVTTDDQLRPDIAEAPDGTFIVVWRSDASAGDDTDNSIQMRRLASDGTPMAADLQVNSYTTGLAYFPKVDIGTDGSFVVVWDSYGGSPGGGSYYNVIARRFASDGSPIAGDFQVNTDGTDYQYSDDVTITPGGGFMVAWSGDAPLSVDTDGYAAIVSRYDSTGVAVGGELVMNSLTTSSQESPSLIIDDQGNFIVAWQSDISAGTDTSLFSVQARFFVTEADVAVTKSNGLSEVVPGTETTYTITVTNNGPDVATGVEVTDSLAASLDCTFTSMGTNGASGQTGSGSGDLAESGIILPPTAEVTYTFTCDVAPDATGTLINTVDVTADQIDSVASNDSATDMDALEPEADLSASLSSNLLTVFPGHTVTLTAGAGNGGPSTATGGDLTIPLPTGLSFVSSAGCTEDAGTVTCSFGSLPPMSEGGIPFTVLVDAGLSEGEMLIVTATVAGDEPDDNGANDSESITLMVTIPLFADGFGNGDTTAWASTVP